MKRIISSALAIITALPLLSGCASDIKKQTSSDTQTAVYEEYLSRRLGDGFGDDVILGTAEDAAEYGFDLTSLRDEGYIIRTLGNDTVIFGKTEDGLDRGVRYYANYCADVDEVNVTYGEGMRVKKIEIAGRDISEYKIYLFPGADQCHTFAAEELQLYIEKACGVHLDIVREEYEHMIALEQVTEDDPRYAQLGDEGFTIAVREDGNLYISGGKWRGCMYGVYEFLETYIGWRFCVNWEISSEITPDSYFLYESDLIELPVGLEDTQVPSFEYRQGRFLGYAAIANSKLSVMHKENDSIRASALYNGYGYGRGACHGLYKGPIRNKYVTEEIVSAEVIRGTEQPCFTDMVFIDACVDYYTDNIESRLALGQEIGKEICEIDVAQNDTSVFCQCKKCLEYIKKDGAYIGPVLYFANYMAEHFGEKYPGIYVSILVYAGTTKPPKHTMPLDNVNASYCFYNDIGKIYCANHSISGVDCTPVSEHPYNITNTPYAEEFEGWCRIANRVTVWYYPGNWWFSQLSLSRLKTIREDINYLYSQGIHGVYPCMSNPDGAWDTQEYLISYLLLECQWNAEMTEEEYWALIEEYLRIWFGGGSDLIADYFRWQITAAQPNCWTLQCFSVPSERINLSKVCEDFEYCISLFERAAELADSSEQENAIRLLSRSMYLTGLIACHGPWYQNGTAEQKARYTEIYDRFKDIALETGYTLDKYALTEEDFDIEVNLASKFPFNSVFKVDWWDWYTAG